MDGGAIRPESAPVDGASVGDAAVEIDLLVIGAGPNGLACADAAARAGLRVEVIERADAPGGLSRSLDVAGMLVDLGNHQLQGAGPEIMALAETLYGAPPRIVSPRSLLRWAGRTWTYPVAPAELLRGVSPVELAAIGGSWLRAKLGGALGGPAPRSLGEATRRDYGLRLYRTLFRPYLEKVWGEDPDALAPRTARAESLWRSLRLTRREASRDVPVLELPDGQGGFYRRWADSLEARGVRLRYGAGLGALRHADGQVAEATAAPADGAPPLRLRPRAVVSTIPLPPLLQAMDPPLPGAAAAPAAEAFRQARLIYLVHAAPAPFARNCLYLADPEVSAIRAASFTHLYGNAARAPGRSILCMEYWAAPQDEIWRCDDDAAVAFAAAEAARLFPQLAEAPLVASRSIRLPNAAPIRRRDAAEDGAAVAAQALSGLANLHVSGRSGGMAYTDQHQAILAGWELGARIAAELDGQSRSATN